MAYVLFSVSELEGYVLDKLTLLSVPSTVQIIIYIDIIYYLYQSIYNIVVDIKLFQICGSRGVSVQLAQPCHHIFYCRGHKVMTSRRHRSHEM